MKLLQAGCDRDQQQQGFQYRGFLKWWVKTPQIIHGLMSFLHEFSPSILGGNTPIFWFNTHMDISKGASFYVCSIFVTFLSYTILVLPCRATTPSILWDIQRDSSICLSCCDGFLLPNLTTSHLTNKSS